jgi:hypothetical protein
MLKPIVQGGLQGGGLKPVPRVGVVGTLGVGSGSGTPKLQTSNLVRPVVGAGTRGTPVSGPVLKPSVSPTPPPSTGVPPKPIPPSSATAIISTPHTLVDQAWVQLDTLKLGDLLTVETASQTYRLSVIGARSALLVSSNPEVPSGVYFLHGSYNDQVDPLNSGSEGTIIWGTLQVGKGLLVAPVGTPSEGIKTSPVSKLSLYKAGTYNSPYRYASSPSFKPLVSSQAPKPLSSSQVSRARI